MIMIISIRDCEEYTQKAPTYKNGIVFVQSGIEKEDITDWVMWLRRFCEKYEGLSFMFITSCVDSRQPIYRVWVRTGKAGKPKLKVIGTPVEKHCHCLIVNESDANDIENMKDDLRAISRKRRKRRPNLKRQKITDAWIEGLPIVSYMTRQMNETKPYTFGSFDFKYFDDIRYCKYPEKEECDDYDNILEFDDC